MSGITLTILGCGNSAGTPAIGNYWGQCDPAEPRNRRTRPAIAIRSANTTIIVDTGPDLREQINRADIQHIDAVLYTHAHGDHVHGIDDLRSLRNRSKKVIDMWGDKPTVEELLERFGYLFADKHEGLYPRVLKPHVFTFGQPLTIGDITVTPFQQDHGTCNSVGLRIGDVAYSTDAIRFNETALGILSGIKTWIVDAAGYKMPENKVHMTLKDLYRVNETVRAEKIYLTHLTPAMDYRMMLKELPNGYEPAWDGLNISCNI